MAVLVDKAEALCFLWLTQESTRENRMTVEEHLLPIYKAFGAAGLTAELARLLIRGGLESHGSGYQHGPGLCLKLSKTQTFQASEYGDGGKEEM